MKKLSKRAELLKTSIVEFLLTYPVVGINMKRMEVAQGYQRRSAQRTVKELNRCNEFVYLERSAGVQLLARNNYDPLLETVKKTGSSGFVNFYEFRGENDISVVSVVSVALYNKDLDIKDIKEPYKIDPKKRDKNDKSDKNDKNDNGAVAQVIPIADPLAITSGEQNEFDELFAMVCTVCNKMPLLIIEDDDRKIERLFKVGATADIIYRHYHTNTRPNYWAYHWKGKKGAAPTFMDILDTYADARIWKPTYTQTLPTLNKIYDDFESLVTRIGRYPVRDGYGKPFEMLAEMGYGPLFEKVGLTWWDLNYNYIEKNRRLIKDAYWSLRNEDKEKKEKGMGKLSR